MRPTIYTVARQAGVSIATVSRVLHNHPLVKAETRAKVMQAVEALGYQPNASARGLAANTTGTIALVFPKLSGPFFSALIRGAEIATSDQMAIGAMAAIHESGLRVPEDIALVGFDDIEIAQYMNPPLTTVHQDMIGQGQLAVRLLLARINGAEPAVETQILPAALVIRRSCGCTPENDIRN